MRTLYVLTRTSGRPEFFRRCRESVLALNYPNVVHIVHSDDPRCEQYIECDILVRGEAHGSYIGTAPYNLYNNRLLSAIPGSGWVHFLDDDDQYVSPDVMDWVTDDLDPELLHVCKARRWEGTVWPRGWKKQKSFQTECFVADAKLAKRGRWWGDKGGDHYYTKQLTRRAGMEWHDVIVAEAQEGKGHGKLVDIAGSVMDYDACYSPDREVWIKLNGDRGKRAGAKLHNMPYSEARVLEKHGYGRVTYRGTGVDKCYGQQERIPITA